MTFEKILWIKKKCEPSSWMPILVGIANGKMHWHAGKTFCNWNPDHYDIVREYSGDAIEQAENDLDTEYAPRPQEPCARLGWVSPEGRFYPCSYRCHTYLENMLGRHLYDSSWPNLRQKGWIELKSQGMICMEYNLVPSQAAKDTIRKIVEAFEFEEFKNPNINWRAILENNPEGYIENNGWSDPTYVSNGTTYAQSLRYSYELYFGDGDIDKEDMHLITPLEFDNINCSKRRNAHPGD